MRHVILASLLTFGLSLSAVAHEGHDHDAPAAVSPKKGGQIKAIESTYVEVLAKGSDVKIYLFDKEMKAVDATPYKASVTAQLPRGKGKPETLKLTPAGDHLAATYDAKSSHRYTLTVNITDPAHGHEDKLQFNIENKK